MFTLTPDAFAAMAAARAETGIPDTYGIRFFGPGPVGLGQESRLSVDFVESPEPDDVVGGGPESGHSSRPPSMSDPVTRRSTSIRSTGISTSSLP